MGPLCADICTMSSEIGGENEVVPLVELIMTCLEEVEEWHHTAWWDGKAASRRPERFHHMIWVIFSPVSQGVDMRKIYDELSSS